MKIDHHQLSQAALQTMIEAFVQREGTDYGQEASLLLKVQQVRHQLDDGSAILVFDVASDSFNIIPQEEYRQKLQSCSF